MKKIILLYLAILFGAYAFSQPLLNATARWNQTFTWSGFGMGTSCNTTYRIEGDSTINDTLYYRVYREGFCVAMSTEWDTMGNSQTTYDTSYFNEPSVFLREQDGRFYMRQSTWADALLYDFNLGESANGEDAMNETVCGISAPSLSLNDTVCIGNVYRKRWSVSLSSYPLANYFIEGVGPSSGFLAPLCRNGCPECSYVLKSFTLNGDTLYQGNCASVLQVNSIPDEAAWHSTSQFLTYRPASEGFLELYNIQGQMLISRYIPNNETGTVELSGLAEGVYMAVFRGKTGHSSFKRICRTGS